jgi:ribose transport system substrate-binding protein
MMGEDCDRNSTDWYNPGIDIWGGADYLDNFFLRPADPEAYDPNS